MVSRYVDASAENANDKKHHISKVSRRKQMNEHSDKYMLERRTCVC
jgi:hypothetical protein